jgi:hypothetical protein
MNVELNYPVVFNTQGLLSIGLSRLALYAWWRLLSCGGLPGFLLLSKCRSLMFLGPISLDFPNHLLLLCFVFNVLSLEHILDKLLLSCRIVLLLPAFALLIWLLFAIAS